VLFRSPATKPGMPGTAPMRCGPQADSSSVQASRSSHRSCIAYRKNLPLVSIGLVPIDHTASVLRIDLHVLGSVHGAAILDSGRLDALKNRVKLFFTDTEAEVLHGKRPVVIDEVEGQAVVNIHGREGPDAPFCPAHSKKFGEAPGRKALVSRGNDHMIELDRHGRVFFQSRNFHVDDPSSRRTRTDAIEPGSKLRALTTIV